MTSFLQPPSTLSMRAATNKEIELPDLDDLFNQYLETDLLQLHDNGSTNPTSSDDLAHLFEDHSTNESDPIETSPMPNWDVTPDEAWHKALAGGRQHSPALRARHALPPSSIYPESRGRASLSDPGLFLLDDLFDLHTKASPRLSFSTPSTPKPLTAKSKPKPTPSSDRTARRTTPTGIRKLATKSSTISPNMIRSAHFRHGYHDMLTRKIEPTLEGLSLQMPPNALPSSPTSSTRFDQFENFYSKSHQPYATISPLATDHDPMSDLANAHSSHYEVTPLSSPALESHNPHNGNAFHGNINMDSTMGGASYLGSAGLGNSSAALSALQTPPPTQSLPHAMSGPGASWGPDTPASIDFSFPTSPEFAHKSHQMWTSGGGPSASAYHTTPSLTAQTGSRPNQNVGFSTTSTSAMVAGLGISCDTSAFANIAELSSCPMTSPFGNGSGLDAAASEFYSSYSNQTSAQQHQHGRITGMHGGRASRSPSPLSPPGAAHPRLRRVRTSTHNLRQQQSSHSHHRRKSSTQSASSAHASHRHSSSKMSGSNAAPVGFVNFTPSDSKKILTGVAPSGSSKTKARREKEAAEKRRKLSQAAVKAVMEAGGDLGRLEAEVGGLLSVD